MKDTFYRLNEAKKRRIIDACVAEFGAQGYLAGSTDRIIKACSISKGGLYEYIDSKEELFVLAASDSYDKLYAYIEAGMGEGRGSPADILERFREVSRVAVDFYLNHPECVRMISQCAHLDAQDLRDKAEKVFRERFTKVFSGLDESKLAFPLDKVLDLMVWLLVRTRSDFLEAWAADGDREASKKAYLDEWEFYLGVLASGIYSKK